jgi:hypothetical protein
MRLKLAVLFVLSAVFAVPVGAHGATQVAHRVSFANGAATHLAPDTTACKRGYYKNVSGHCVRRPSHDPSGATAKCRDGTYSYSEHASGTCSHHGGVARWIRHP